MPWVEKVGGRKLQFSDRQVQNSDSKICTEKYQKLSHSHCMGRNII